MRSFRCSPWPPIRHGASSCVYDGGCCDYVQQFTSLTRVFQSQRQLSHFEWPAELGIVAKASKDLHAARRRLGAFHRENPYLEFTEMTTVLVLVSSCLVIGCGGGKDTCYHAER
jgi:hypothetical protein